jgi:hypothetical protein
MLERLEAWLEYLAERQQRKIRDERSFEYSRQSDADYHQDELLVDQLVAWICPKLLWLLPLAIFVAAGIGYAYGLVLNG